MIILLVILMLWVDGRLLLFVDVHAVCMYCLCVLLVGIGFRCSVFVILCCRVCLFFVWRSLCVPRGCRCLLSRLSVLVLFVCSLSCLVFFRVRLLLCSDCCLLLVVVIDGRCCCMLSSFVLLCRASFAVGWC